MPTLKVTGLIVTIICIIILIDLCFHAGFDGSHASKQNQEDEQDPHPRITHVKYKVENILHEHFQLKGNWQGRITVFFFL